MNVLSSVASAAGAPKGPERALRRGRVAAAAVPVARRVAGRVARARAEIPMRPHPASTATIAARFAETHRLPITSYRIAIRRQLVKRLAIAQRGVMAHVGIDFGTTNTAVAIADDAGDVKLVPLAGAPHWRTVLYFEPNGTLTAGTPALARYLETGGEGRLIQSIKSHLASASFSKTQIFARRWVLEDMIAAFLRQVRAAAPIDLGSRCVIGRPVRYWGAEDAADDARAVTRMRTALAAAGFDEVHFEYEPVGAAARYAARLANDELIVVADFGGGTTDFTVVRVGPSFPSAAPCSPPVASASPATRSTRA